MGLLEVAHFAKAFWNEAWPPICTIVPPRLLPCRGHHRTPAGGFSEVGQAETLNGKSHLLPVPREGIALMIWRIKVLAELPCDVSHAFVLEREVPINELAA